jgi:hypothetical protein
VLTTSDLIAWLASLGIGSGLAVDVPVFPGPWLPKMPDELAVVTPISGPGEWLDGSGDVAGFQLRIRGRQDITGLSASGEANALAADRLILTAPLPALVGGVHLLPLQRSGGRPAPLPDPDGGDRLSFTCTYLTSFVYA